MKKVLFIFLQCTWGIGQTLLGAIVFLLCLRQEHKGYRGCIDTRWNSQNGMSLGLFIFTPKEETRDNEKIRIHEYGHCIQSMVLGPLYLIVGLISVLWGNLPYFVKLRRKKSVHYTACFVEAWASKWGERVTGEKAI